MLCKLHLPAAFASILFFAGSLLANQTAYEKTLRSTALVLTGEASGTGVLVDADQRLLVTGYHVIAGQSEVNVVFPDRVQGRVIAEGRHYQKKLANLKIHGTVKAIDPSRDLAVIELDRIPSDVQAIQLAETTPSPGQAVHAIGNPSLSGALWVYSTGSIRAVYRKQFNLDQNQPVDAQVIETQAPANPGDSGGPMTNDEGELIGIVSGRNTDADLISVAISVEEVRSLLAGENRTIDSTIRQTLDDANLDYTVSAEGLFQIHVPTDANRQAEVFVASRLEDANGYPYRRIVSPSIVFDKAPPASLPNLLMELNAKTRIGAWYTNEVDGSTFVNYALTADPEVNGDRLLALVNLAASESDALAAFAEKANTKDTAPTDEEAVPAEQTEAQLTSAVPAVGTHDLVETENDAGEEMAANTEVLAVPEEMFGAWQARITTKSTENAHLLVALNRQNQIRIVLFEDDKQSFDLISDYVWDGETLEIISEGRKHTIRLVATDEGQLSFEMDQLHVLMDRITDRDVAATKRCKTR